MDRLAEVLSALPAAPEDDALPAFLQGLIADLESADPFALDARLRRAITDRAPVHAETWIAFAPRVSVRRLRDDVDRALLLAETDPAAFARSGGLPDLEDELACASDAEAARLQTGANPTDLESTPLAGDPTGSAPRETARAFFNAPRDVARLFQATLCTVRRRLGASVGRPATLSSARTRATTRRRT